MMGRNKTKKMYLALVCNKLKGRLLEPESKIVKPLHQGVYQTFLSTYSYACGSKT